MAKRFFIKRKDFKKLERYAENIYNTGVVIDYFGRKVSLGDKRKVVEIISKHCLNAGIQDFEFYDLYYSTVSKQLELKRVVVL